MRKIDFYKYFYILYKFSSFCFVIVKFVLDCFNLSECFLFFKYFLMFDGVVWFFIINYWNFYEKILLFFWIPFWDGVPSLLDSSYFTMKYFWEYFVFIGVHFSWLPFMFLVNWGIQYFVLKLFGIVVFFGIFLDFLSLSFISSKNQKFLQNHPEKISKNKTFITFFILWRFFLPDIFVASSLSAHFTRMNLSKMQIFILASVAQILRFSTLYMIYVFFI